MSLHSINIGERSMTTSQNTQLCLSALPVIGDLNGGYGWLDDCTIKLLCLKYSGSQCSDEGRITDFDFMDCVIQIVGKSLHCLQLDRNLCRIYRINKDAHSPRQKTCFRMELLFGMPQFLSLIHTLTRLETTMLMKKLRKSWYAIYGCL